MGRARGRTYAANFGEDHVFCGDIAHWADADIPLADVVEFFKPEKGRYLDALLAPGSRC